VAARHNPGARMSADDIARAEDKRLN